MLDKNGFQRKNYAEYKAEMDERAKELFGDDINLSPKSIFGILFALFAWFLATMAELAEKVYHSGHPSEAEGVQLDYLGAYFDTSRQMEQWATTTLAFTGTANYTIVEGTPFQTSNGVTFSLTENVTLNASGIGTGEVVAIESGVAGNVSANSITIQSEPSADVLTVTNTIAATGGRSKETDAEYRARMANSGGAGGSGTPNAILADVLDVQGVRAANISVNSTNATVNGQPPKSNHVFVLGGNGQDIAEALFKNYVGLQFFGSSSYNVVDIGGNTHVMAYTPSTGVNIFATITVTTDNTFTTDGSQLIKDAVIRLIGGTDSTGTAYNGLNMGDDVIYSKLLAAVMAIQGVVDATVKIGKVVGTQTSTNIAILPNEVAQLNDANISVVIT